MTKTVFRAVRLLDTGADDGMSGPTDVLVAGGRIAAVGSPFDAEEAGATVVDGSHHLLLPGLINAHFHSPVNHLKGALASMPLELFMLYESSADESLRPTPREAYLRTALGALEMLRSGTTAVADDAFLMPTPEPDVIDAVCQAYVDCGIRATVALDQPELSEGEKLPPLPGLPRSWLDAPPPMCAPALLERYQYLFAYWHGAAGGRIRAAVSISAPQRVSPEYFAALDDLSKRHATPLFAHVLETKMQRTLAATQPRFGGRSLVRYTADLGLLSERTDLIHAIWVDGADLDLIAESGATVVHCPVSNLRLGSGIMPFRAMRERGIPVALGTDEAICGDTADLWATLRAAGLVHNVTGDRHARWPSAAEVLEACWAGGTAALRLPEPVAAVAPGALADLTLLDLHSPVFTPLTDAAVQLVGCETGASVALTMVDGQVVAQRGHSTVVDEAALLDEAREVFAARMPAWRAAWRQMAKQAPGYEAAIEQARLTDVGFTRWGSTEEA